MKPWLVSYFAPFAGAATNSSQIVLEKAKRPRNVRLKGPLPVEFNGSWQALQALLERDSYRGAVIFGQAMGRVKLSLERVAFNWRDASLADERGYQPLGEKIVNGDEARWSNIPWDDFTENEFAGRSYSAGAFVCNEIMYRLIEYAEPRGILSGFVHVPVLESQVGFSLGTKTMREDLAIRETERVLGFLAGL